MILEKIKQLKQEKPDDFTDQIEEICNEIEDILGPAEMWNTLRPGFSYDELIENLEYIARETDI